MDHSISSLSKFEDAFKKLKVNSSKGGAPYTYRPCLLLAVIDQFETKNRIENRFRYEEELPASHNGYLQLSGRPYIESNAYQPFLYLNSAPFWNLHDHEGNVLNYTPTDVDQLKKQGFKKMQNIVSHVTLDNELFELLKCPVARTQLREVLIQRWFPDKVVEFRNAIREIQILNGKYAKEEFVGEFQYVSEYLQYIRKELDPIFKYRVLRAYDFRCAATGWQLKAPSIQQKSIQVWSTLLEAAHIMPGNNRINNGIALMPTLHLAMDRHLIAPGPDYRWHVSDFVREQAQYDDGARQICAIHKKNIIGPKNPALKPTQSALEWSLDHLLTT